MYLCWFSSSAKHVAFLLLSRKAFCKMYMFFSVLSPKKVPQIPIFKILHCWLWYKNKGTQSSYKLHFMSLAGKRVWFTKKRWAPLSFRKMKQSCKKNFPPQNAICRVCLLTARHLVSERNTSQQKSSIWKERKEKKKTILSLRLVMFKCSFGLPGSLDHKLYRLRISLPQTPK